MGFKILAINPGSTSTKIALYDDEQPTLALTLRHSAEEIARFPRIIDQLDWRKEMVLEALAKNNFEVPLGRDRSRRSDQADRIGRI